MEAALLAALKPLAELGILAVLIPLVMYSFYKLLQAHSTERKEWSDSQKTESKLTRETVDKNTAAIEHLSNALLYRSANID